MVACQSDGLTRALLIDVDAGDAGAAFGKPQRGPGALQVADVVEQARVAALHAATPTNSATAMSTMRRPLRSPTDSTALDGLRFAARTSARHADPKTTRRYDRARHALNRHASYAIAHYLAGHRPILDSMILLHNNKYLAWESRMSGDDRWQVLLDRLATLRQAIVPGVLLGAVHMINDLDLSLTHLATLYVLQQHEALSVNQVAETIGISVSGASRVVDHLVGHGLVSRTEDARDRRAKRVSISPTGRELLRTFERDVTEAQFSVIADLPADDQAVIIRAVDLMAGAAAARVPATLGRAHLPVRPSPPPRPADQSPRLRTSDA